MMNSKDDELPANEKNQTSLNIITEEPTENETKSMENDIAMKCERSKSLDPTHLKDLKEMKYRVASLMSLGDWDGAITLKGDNKPEKNKKWCVNATKGRVNKITLILFRFLGKRLSNCLIWCC